MGPAPHNVLLVELLVVGDRLGEPLHRVCHTFLEPSAPELGLLALLRHSIALGSAHGFGGAADLKRSIKTERGHSMFGAHVVGESEWAREE